jgi:regulator of protease activity HflC (stomatin/prohibitin superfamily)
LSIIVISGCYTTGPTEVGIRTRKITFFGLLGEKGVEDKLYQPGSTYILLPIINDFDTLDIKLQNMEMMGKDHNLLFKTIDGNDITLDVIITYRVDPEMAHYIIQYVAKNDEELMHSVVRTICRSRPRDIFGELKTEDFYVAKNRDEKSEKAKKILNDILNPYGIIVERVSTKDYGFNPEYTKAIEDKKVADQLAEKYKSEAKAKEEEYRRKLNDAVGEVNKMVAEADGNYRKAIIEADAYYEKQKMISEAILVEGKAESEAIRKLNNALTGTGGEIMVKLEIAKALKGKRIMLLPISGGSVDLKTTDINKLLEVYGAKKLSEGKKENKENK